MKFTAIIKNAEGARGVLWEVHLTCVDIGDTHVVQVKCYEDAEPMARDYLMQRFDLRPSEVELGPVRPDMPEGVFEHCRDAQDKVAQAKQAWLDSLAERNASLAVLLDKGFTHGGIAELWGITRARVTQIAGELPDA